MEKPTSPVTFYLRNLSGGVYRIQRGETWEGLEWFELGPPSCWRPTTAEERQHETGWLDPADIADLPSEVQVFERNQP
jgi:hypothetical protein